MNSKNRHISSSVKTIGIVFISLSILIIFVCIFMMIISPNDIFQKEMNSGIIENFPIAYRIYFNLIFQKTNIFGSILIAISVFTIFVAINFMKFKKWTTNYIEIITWLLGIIIFIFWINFLIFVFDVNSIVPDLNLKGFQLNIYRILGFLMSLLHLIFIFPLIKIIRLLRSKKIKDLFYKI